MIWHSADLDSIKKELSTDFDKGLTGKQAAEKAETVGENVIKVYGVRKISELILNRLKTLPSVLFICSAFISLLINMLNKNNSVIDNIALPFMILLMLALYIAVYVFCERHTDKTVAKLESLHSTKVKLLRDSAVRHADSTNLVPGDIVRFDAGDYIPCDCRIIKSADLRCNESGLTGEDLPINKSESAELTDITPLEERRNMLYCGTFVTNGSAVAVVVEVGNKCEIGKLSKINASDKENKVNSLEKKFDIFAKQVRTFAIISAVILMAVGLIIDDDKAKVFLTALAFAEVTIPGFVSAACLLTTSHAALNLAKKKTFASDIQKLSELGRTTVLCVDKTGILTKNKMELVSAYTPNGFVKSFKELDSQEITLLRFAALCCDTKLKGEKPTDENADPTEVALLKSVLKYTGSGKENLDTLYPRLTEIPFDADRKAMSTVHMISGNPVAIVKGAPEYLFDRCLEIDRPNAEKANKLMCSRELRTLAVCYKPLTAIPTNPTPDEIENNLTFLGLVGLIDPPNEQAKDYIASCKTAGITPVMITGDHAETAMALSLELGIVQSDEHTAISGDDIKDISDDELAKRIKDVRVCARLSSEDKQRIIHAYQKNGEVVAVTGYSDIDAPALKSADVGYALGNNDIAVKSADVVSENDDFRSILSAISYGRSIHANMQRFVEFFVTSAIGQFLFLLLSVILWNNPFNCLQVLWLNLIVLISAFALCCEPANPEVMEKAPSTGYEKVTSVSMLKRIAIHSVTLFATVFAAYLIGKRQGGSASATAAFAVMSFSLLITAYNVRSKRSLFKTGIFKNKLINLISAVSAVLTAIIVIIPFKLLSASAVSLKSWLWVIGLSLINFVVSEFAKLCERLFGDK